MDDKVNLGSIPKPSKPAKNLLSDDEERPEEMNKFVQSQKEKKGFLNKLFTKQKKEANSPEAEKKLDDVPIPDMANFANNNRPLDFTVEQRKPEDKNIPTQEDTSATSTNIEAITKKLTPKKEIPKKSENMPETKIQFDLDDIRKKLGIAEEEAPTTTETQKPEKAKEPWDFDLGSEELDFELPKPDSPYLPEWDFSVKDGIRARTKGYMLLDDDINKYFNEIEEEGKAVQEELHSIKIELKPRNIPESKIFHVCNGAKLTTIYDLLNQLKHMTAQEFSVHTNKERNDFADWVKHVLKMDNLYLELINKNEKEEMYYTLRYYLKNKEDRMKELEEKLHRLQSIKNLRGLIEDSPERREMQIDMANRIKELEEEKNRLEKEYKEELVMMRREKKSYEMEFSKKLRDLTTEREKILSELHQKKHQQKLELENKLSELERELQRKREAFEKEIASIRTSLEKGLRELKYDRKEFDNQKALFDSTKRENETILSREKEKLSRLREEHEKRYQEAINELRVRRQEMIQKKEEMDAKMQDDITELNEHRKKIKRLEDNLIAKMRDLNQRELEIIKRENIVKEDEIVLGTKRKNAEDMIRRAHSFVDNTPDKPLSTPIEPIDFKQDDDIPDVPPRRNLEDEIPSPDEDEKPMSYQDYMVSTFKKDTVPVPEPKKEKTEYVKMHAMIEKCRKAVKLKKSEEAQTLYSKLRDTFYQTNFGSNEKEKNTIYTAIRELYNDIHLGMLEK